MSDPHDLERFVDAQEGVYPQALEELRAGRKTSHWMWFVLPQIAGLGRSAMAERYAIRSLAEARAYLAHPLLGHRLEACVAALLDHRDRTATAILGSPDDVKLRSCLTLFEAAAPERAEFAAAIDTFFGGSRDEETLRRLQ